MVKKVKFQQIKENFEEIENDIPQAIIAPPAIPPVPLKGTTKRALFVINNYTEDDINMLKICERFKYLIFGKEIGEEGTPHLQGYCEMLSATHWNVLHKITKVHGHWQKPDGTATNNIRYCKKGNQPKAEYDELHENGPNYGKDADIFEKGTPSEGQGTRKDIHELIKKITEQKITVEQIAINNPVEFTKFNKALYVAESKTLRENIRKEKPTCEWLYGPAGVGKTYRAMKNDKYTESDIYEWEFKDKDWQDGYHQQPRIVLNEFRGQLTFSDLLRLTDKYSYRMPRRGKEPIVVNSKEIIFTSDKSPEKTYYNIDEADMKQLLRRINKITKMEFDGNPSNNRVWITENIYDDKGYLKTTTRYHRDDPSFIPIVTTHEHAFEANGAEIDPPLIFN